MQAMQSSAGERSEPSATTPPPADGFNQSLLAALVAAGADRRLQSDVPVDPERLERLLIEADEITFRVGGATLSLTKENGGTLEIRAGHVRIHAEEILSEAAGTNAITGETVVAEAEMHADLLGKLVRIDGQCVKINS
jgi:hypothetical protein